MLYIGIAERYIENNTATEYLVVVSKSPRLHSGRILFESLRENESLDFIEKFYHTSNHRIEG